MPTETHGEIDAGYELAAQHVRAWVGGIEVRLESQWQGLLPQESFKMRPFDLIRLGGEYDSVAARLDLYAGLFGVRFGVTRRFAASRGGQRVRQAARDAATAMNRMTR